MNKLAEMWAALATYQPEADAAGYGKSWAKMCSEKTADDAFDANDAAWDAADAPDAGWAARAAAAAAAAAAAGWAAGWAAEMWAQKAIDIINKAKENT